MENHHTRRSINDLIQSFRSLESNVLSQEGCKNGRLIEPFDGQLAEKFDRILDFSPKCRNEAVELAKFLLQALDDAKMGSTLPDQINDKILEIVATDYQIRPIEND